MDQSVDHSSRRRTASEAWIRPAAFWTFSILAVALCAAVEICPRLARHRELASQAGTLGAEIDRLRQENEQLAHQIEALDNDPFFIEQVARRDMGFHRPGERRLRMGQLYVAAPPRRELEREPWPWLVKLERLFAYDSDVRRTALVTGAVLVLCAFVCFPSRLRRRQAPDRPAEPARPAFPEVEEPILPPQRKAG